GSPRIGKSYFMKQVMNEVTNKGYDIEVYRCPFNSDCIDMVIIREMNYCIVACRLNESHKEKDHVIVLQEIVSNDAHSEEDKNLFKQLNEKFNDIYTLGLTELSKLQNITISYEFCKIYLII